MTRLVLLVLAACGAAPSADGAGVYDVTLTPEMDPPQAGGPVSHAIEVWAGDVAEAGAALVVTPWMPDHGHGVSEPPVVTELGDGVYDATWTYPMPGYWEIEVQLDGSAGLDTVTVAYEVE